MPLSIQLQLKDSVTFIVHSRWTLANQPFQRQPMNYTFKTSCAEQNDEKPVAIYEKNNHGSQEILTRNISDP